MPGPQLFKSHICDELLLCLPCPLGWRTHVGRPSCLSARRAALTEQMVCIRTLNFVLIEMLADTEAPPGGR